MTGGMTGADEMRNLLKLGTTVPLVKGGEEEEARMVHLKEGLRRRRDAFRCRRGEGKLRDGMCMPLATSNILQCKRNKLVFSTFQVPTARRYLLF